MSDIALFLMFLSGFLVGLAIGGLIIDWLDPYDERRDAQRRNHR